MSQKLDRFDIGCHFAAFSGVGINKRGCLTPHFQRNGEHSLRTNVAKSSEETLVRRLQVGRAVECLLRAERYAQDGI